MNNCEILLGNKAFFNRTVFQACAAKTTTLKEAKLTMEAMKAKFKNCTWAGIAYRTTRGEDCYEEIEGLGRKVLILISRMEVNNLTIGVSVWYCGSITNHDCNRMVLDRVMDLVNYINSLIPAELKAGFAEVDQTLIEPTPIESHKYPEFPQRPSPGAPAPFDFENDRLRKELIEINSLFDDAEAKSLHELTSHSMIGKILQLLYCILTSIPCTPQRLKNFFKNEKILQLMKEFEPNNMKKRKIRELKKLLELYSYLEVDNIERISHSSVLILQFVKTVALINEEVPMPKPHVRTTLIVETTPEVEIKPIIYRPLCRPRPKEGNFLDTAEMVLDDKFKMHPSKIEVKLNDISEADLRLNKLNRYGGSYAIERYSSVDLYSKIRGISTQNIHKNNISKQSIHLSKFSLRGMETSKKSINYSKKSINYSKKSIETSKKSIEMSSQNLAAEEIIENVLKMKSQRVNSWDGLDLSELEGDSKPTKLEDLAKQTNILIKLADILRDRREAHSLL